MRVEELFLEGEDAIKNGNYIAAKIAFENALMEDHEYAPAHNSLGWLYKSQFDDYEKAINHFNASISYAPGYPHSYLNLVDVFILKDDWDAAKKILKKASKIGTVHKAKIEYNLGRICELTADLTNAIEHYKKALLHTINNDLVEDYKKDMERCRYKLELLAG